MNLKSYAVLRKLTANSEFLNYVVEDKPIPVNMLETELHDLLKDIKVDDVDLLINNYQKYLRDNVKLGFQQTQNNQFDVNGEIEDPIIETIELLHDVKPNDVVTNLVISVMSELSPDRDVKIDSIELKESTKKFVQMTEKPLFGNNDNHIANNDQDVEASNIEQSNNQENVESDNHINESTIQDTLDNIDNIDALDNIDVDNVVQNAESIPAERSSDETPEVEPEQDHVNDVSDNANEPEYDFAKESLPDTNIELSAPTFEEPNEEELQQEAKSTVNAFKEAYDYLVSQIKEKNLDDRLPGLHLAI